MEQQHFPVKLFSAIAIVSSLTIAACNNNDTNTTETTLADTTKMMTDTAAAKPAMVDSGAMMPSATDTSAMNVKGMAKPNTSKKGMKGKISIVTPAPSKMKGDMKPDASGVYSSVDYIPSFPGGNAGLQKFFDDNIQYPTVAQDEGVEGIVKISFTVDENGMIMSPSIEGDKQGYGLDNEALRIVKKMPAWNPGKIAGKPVKTRFTLPVNFVLATSN